MTLTFDEAMENLEAVLESAMLDLEIESLNEANTAADQYLIDNGLNKTDATMKQAEQLIGAKSFKERRDEIKTEPEDKFFSKAGKVAMRAIWKMLELLEKFFGMVKKTFASVGTTAFNADKAYHKGLVNYQSISAFIAQANKLMLSANAAGAAFDGKLDTTDVLKIVPKGSVIRLSEVAKCAGAIEAAARRYRQSRSFPNVTGKLTTPKVNQQALGIMKELVDVLSMLKKQADELYKDLKKKPGVSDKSATRAEKAKGQAANHAIDVHNAFRDTTNESVSAAILLDQAQSLLAEGAIDDAYVLMATAKSLMENAFDEDYLDEGAEEYTEGLGTDLTMFEEDRCDTVDSEVTQDEYDSDVVGGEGQDPDEDIKEVLGNNKVALALMTDDEGNETVHEEVEIIL